LCKNEIEFLQEINNIKFYEKPEEKQSLIPIRIISNHPIISYK